MFRQALAEDNLAGEPRYLDFRMRLFDLALRFDTFEATIENKLNEVAGKINTNADHVADL